MPTGYTHPVQEGKVTTLEGFAKDCARAFLWQARDSNEKDLVKLVSNEGTLEYYVKRLKEAEVKMAELSALDDAGWQHKYADRWAKELRRVTEYNLRKDAECARYKEMLQKVKQWTPPTEKHIELKNFMIEQLEKSIDFDCVDCYTENRIESFDSWKKFTYENAQTDIIKAQEEIARHTKRKDEFLDWVIQLEDSVKGL